VVKKMMLLKEFLKGYYALRLMKDISYGRLKKDGCRTGAGVPIRSTNI
jgi:hypothetical protein